MMLYNIRIEFMDGTVEKFQRKSNIKPINCDKLNDKIISQIFPREWKEVSSIPVY
jgi:hypothetical protein